VSKFHEVAVSPARGVNHGHPVWADRNTKTHVRVCDANEHFYDVFVYPFERFVRRRRHTEKKKKISSVLIRYETFTDDPKPSITRIRENFRIFGAEALVLQRTSRCSTRPSLIEPTRGGGRARLPRGRHDEVDIFTRERYAETSCPTGSRSFVFRRNRKIIRLHPGENSFPRTVAAPRRVKRDCVRLSAQQRISSSHHPPPRKNDTVATLPYSNFTFIE